MNKKMIFMTIVVLLMAASAFAQPVAPAPTGVRWNLVSAAFLLGIAAACDGIARNPSAGGAIRTAMIIGLALIESLVIYALIIAFMAMRS